MKENTTGILLQGDIRGWTIPIIEEYQKRIRFWQIWWLKNRKIRNNN